MKNDYSIEPIVYSGYCTHYYLITTDGETEVYDSKEKKILKKNSSNTVTLILDNFPWDLQFEVSEGAIIL